MDLRARVAATYELHRFTTAISADYVGSYIDTYRDPETRTSSWTRLNLHLAYRFISPSEAGARLALNVQNLLDKDPPFIDTPGGYDTANGDLLGRFVSMQLRYRW